MAKTTVTLGAEVEAQKRDALLDWAGEDKRPSDALREAIEFTLGFTPFFWQHVRQLAERHRRTRAEVVETIINRYWAEKAAETERYGESRIVVEFGTNIAGVLAGDEQRESLLNDFRRELEERERLERKLAEYEKLIPPDLKLRMNTPDELRALISYNQSKLDAGGSWGSATVKADGTVEYGPLQWRYEGEQQDIELEVEKLKAELKRRGLEV
jgi:hypothetical protein